MGRKMVLVVFALSLLFATYSFSNAAEAEIKLKFASLFTPVHKNALVLQAFCDEVNKKTNGKVSIALHSGSTLITGPKMAAGIQTGVADIGLSHTSFSRGRFPVTEVMELPVGFPSAWISGMVSNDFYAKFTPKEWEAYHPLFFAASGPNVVQTLTKQVRTVEDMKGLKLRAVGRNGDVAKALGAVPVPLEIPDLYDSLRRGVIDGNLLASEGLKGFKLSDLIKFETASWKYSPTHAFYVIMNKKKWDSLPNDVKKVFTDLSPVYADKLGVQWNELEVEGIEAMKAQGGQLLQIPAAEDAKWAKALEPLMGEYKKEMVGKGFKEAEVDSWFKFIQERIEYWKGVEKSRKIPTAFQY